MEHRKPPLPAYFSNPTPGICRWCNKPMTKVLKNGKLSKSTWHDKCVKEYKLLHWPSYTRKAVWKRDKGNCSQCSTVCDKRGPNGWHMDHIVPLYSVQGQLWAWGLGNLQTLCKPCHKIKTSSEATARALVRKTKSK